MDDNKNISDTINYLTYAKDDEIKWRELINKEIVYNNELLGKGIITGINKTDTNIFVEISLYDNKYDEDKVKNVVISALEKVMKILNLSDIEGYEQFCFEQKEILMKLKEKEEEEKRLTEEKLKKLKEVNKRKSEFYYLCDKYDINYNRGLDVIEFLFSLLEKYDLGFELTYNEIEALEANQNHWYYEQYDYSYWLAKLCYERYEKYNEEWMLVKASKYYRISGKPNKALKITENFTTDDKNVYAAYWTTRGGAFKDVKKLDEAVQCVEKSLKINNENHHPYNLAGSIEFIKGNIEKAQEFFDKAMILGAKSIALSKDDIKDVIEKSTKQQSEKIKSYLLKLNQEKYYWIKWI